MKFTLLVISLFIDSPTIYCWYWNVWERTLLLKSCVAGVEQMGYLICMYVVFDLLGKFHFVSLSSYLIPSQLPHINRLRGVWLWTGDQAGEEVITWLPLDFLRIIRFFFPSSQSLIGFCHGKTVLEQPGGSNTAQQLLGLRTELKIVGSEIL